MSEHDEGSGLADRSRRRLLGVTAVGATLPLMATSHAEGQTPDVRRSTERTADLRLSVNGRRHRLTIDPRTTLLDALREPLGLAGTKKGCDQGQCGACTVHIDGKAELSCLTLALAAEDRDVVTIEGVVDGDRLHPMQQAFIDNDALQCGYCTPGQIMSAIICIRDGHAGTDDAVREYMSGNLCRCAAYPNIVAAIRQVAATGRTG